jgi:hypothetical protein
MLGASTTGSFRNSRFRLKAGFSIRASAVRPGRDNEPVALQQERFPRTELINGSSFFIVRSFPSSLVSKVRYYDLG